MKLKIKYFIFYILVYFKFDISFFLLLNTTNSRMLKHKKGESVITYKDDKIKVI